MNMSDVVDTAFSLEQAGGNEELAKELFEMLLNELPLLRDQLKTAIQEKNMPTMWDHAHKIYGSTAYCGVPALRKTAQALETAIKEEDLARIGSEFEITNSEIDKVLATGKKILAQSWR